MVANPLALRGAGPVKRGVGGGEPLVQKLLGCGVVNGPNRLKVTFSPATLPAKPDKLALSLVVARPTTWEVCAAVVVSLGVAQRGKLPALKSCRSAVTDGEARVSERNVAKQPLRAGEPRVAVRSIPDSKKPLVPTEPGAQGVVIGRNVWGHTHPRAMVMALSQLIHDNVSVEQALDTVARSSRS